MTKFILVYLCETTLNIMVDSLKIFTLAIVFLTLNQMVSAQDVDLKKGIVYVDGAECLKYDGENVPGITYSDFNGNELFYIGFARDENGTFWKVKFLAQQLKMSYRVNFSTKAAFIKKLVKENVLTNCAIDVAKLDNFILKFDENLDKD